MHAAKAGDSSGSKLGGGDGDRTASTQSGGCSLAEAIEGRLGQVRMACGHSTGLGRPGTWIQRVQDVSQQLRAVKKRW